MYTNNIKKTWICKLKDSIDYIIFKQEKKYIKENNFQLDATMGLCVEGTRACLWKGASFCMSVNACMSLMCVNISTCTQEFKHKCIYANVFRHINSNTQV